jgi:lysophospholipase L1-like esterase
LGLRRRVALQVVSPTRNRVISSVGRLDRVRMRRNISVTSSKSLPSITLYMIGDSTMADKPVDRMAIEQGWGQKMPEFVNSKANISNHAQNGRSSRSFIEEGLWAIVLNSLQLDDWVIIQFGHNDNKDDPARHTDPFTTYAANLRMFAEEVGAKGAHPIICTSIVRGSFTSDGVLENTHGDYLEAAIMVAQELSLPLLDLEKDTAKLVTSLWPSELKKFYVPEDNSHLTPWGAVQVAEMAAGRIREQNLLLAAYLR